MPQSPYIDRLKRAIAESSDPILGATYRAELAGALARSGEFGAAESEIANLRAQFGDGRSGRVSIMIMCAEAQLIYYRNLGEQARDRMMRAQLLSVAGRDASLSALTSAWLAHICFNLHRHEEMVRSAKTCLDTISGTDHDAASRLALTLADAFYAAQQPEVGNRWYSRAHEHAVKLGDHATIAALTYNRAAMGTFMARVRAVDAPIDPEAAARLTGEVRTAVNYQAVAQLTSLQVLLDYSLASANILGGRYTEAAELLSKIMADAAGTSPMDRSPALQCDLSLALAKSGRLDEAKAIVQPLELSHLAACTPDDQVVALAALIEIYRSCSLEARLPLAEAALRDARKEHGTIVESLRRSLAGFSDEASFARMEVGR